MLESADSQTWRDFMSKHGRSTANPRAEGKRSRIQSWLMQEGWKISEAHNPQASWVITATNDANQSIVVVQPSRLPDRIEIQASVTISEEHQRTFANMDREKREALWWDLRLDLLKLGLDFQGMAEPVTHIVMMQRIYDDGLTKDRFTQRLSKVKAGVLLALWRIGRAVQQPLDELDSDFTN